MFDQQFFDPGARHRFLRELVENVDNWLQLEHEESAQITAEHPDGSVDVTVSNLHGGIDVCGHDPYVVVVAWVGACKDSSGTDHEMIEFREEPILLTNAVASLVGIALLNV